MLASSAARGISRKTPENGTVEAVGTHTYMSGYQLEQSCSYRGKGLKIILVIDSIKCCVIINV